MPLVAWGDELDDLYLNVHVGYLRHEGPDINNEKRTAYLGSDVYIKLSANNYEIFSLHSVSPTYSLFVPASNIVNVEFRHGVWSMKAYERGIELESIYGSNVVFIKAYPYLNNLRVLDGSIYVDNNRMSFFRLLPTLIL